MGYPVVKPQLPRDSCLDVRVRGRRLLPPVILSRVFTPEQRRIFIFFSEVGSLTRSVWKFKRKHGEVGAEKKEEVCGYNADCLKHTTEIYPSHGT